MTKAKKFPRTGITTQSTLLINKQCSFFGFGGNTFQNVLACACPLKLQFAIREADMFEIKDLVVNHNSQI